MTEDKLLYGALLTLAKKRRVGVMVESLPEEFLLECESFREFTGCYFMYWEGYCGMIFINKAFPFKQRLRILAHELSHHQLHYGRFPAGYDYDQAVRVQVEAETDRYANRLLSYLRQRLGISKSVPEEVVA